MKPNTSKVLPEVVIAELKSVAKAAYPIYNGKSSPVNSVAKALAICSNGTATASAKEIESWKGKVQRAFNLKTANNGATKVTRDVIGKYFEYEDWNNYITTRYPNLKNLLDEKAVKVNIENELSKQTVYQRDYENIKLDKNEITNYLENILKKVEIIKTPLLKDNLPINKTVSISLTPLMDKTIKLDYEKNNDIKTLDFFIKREGIVLIEGDPNGGKTTLLKRFVNYLCIIERSHKNTLVPLLIDLTNCLGLTLEKEIMSNLLSNGIYLKGNSLEEFLQINNFIILLDGFDEEIGDKSKLSSEIKRYSRFFPMVVTSRVTDELFALKSNINFYVLKLDKLSYSEQVSIILEVVGKKDLNHFLNQIENEGIHGLESNPLFLQLLIQYYNDSNKEVTNNLYTLYDFVIKNILNWKLTLPPLEVFSNPNGYPKVKIDILKELAYTMLNTKQRQLTKYETNEFIDNWLKKNNYSKVGDLRLFIYEDLLTSKLLIESNDKISFFQRSFMDYFSLSLIENESKKEQKNRFYSKNSNFPLKLLFSKNQNLTFLKLYKPKRKNLLFLDREKASNWIFNYCSCLQSIKVKNRIEHDFILSIIKFLFSELDNFSSNKINLMGMFYDAKFGYENLFGALGELNYEPASEFYLNYLKNHREFVDYGFFGLEHFKFDIKNIEVILDLYLLLEHSYSFNNLIKELVLEDNNFVGTIILKKFNSSTDILIREKLIELVLLCYFDFKTFEFVMSKEILDFLIEEMLYEEDEMLQWDICYKVGRLFLENNFIKKNQLISEFKESFINRLSWAIFQQDNNFINKNVVRAISLCLRIDIRFENLYTVAIKVADEAVLRRSLFFDYDFKFKNPENENKYFNRVYEIFDSFPFLRADVLKAIENGKSELSRKDKELVLECLKTIFLDYDKIQKVILELTDVDAKSILEILRQSRFNSQDAALDIIISKNIIEAKSILVSIIEEEGITNYLLCRSIEAMIYLQPSLYQEGYHSEFINRFNALAKITLEIASLEHIIENRLNFIGNFDTIEILEEIKKKLEEDIQTKVLKEQYRVKPVHYIYPDLKRPQDLWYIIQNSIRNIKRKLNFVEANCNTKIS